MVAWNEAPRKVQSESKTTYNENLLLASPMRRTWTKSLINRNVISPQRTAAPYDRLTPEERFETSNFAMIEFLLFCKPIRSNPDYRALPDSTRICRRFKQTLGNLSLPMPKTFFSQFKAIFNMFNASGRKKVRVNTSIESTNISIVAPLQPISGNYVHTYTWTYTYRISILTHTQRTQALWENIGVWRTVFL